ncbi:MAG: hypothetical protein RSB76_02465 [Clostridia bacterium]
MSFVKGAFLGIVAGTIVGTMNSDRIYVMLNKGKRQMKKMKKKYSM